MCSQSCEHIQSCFTSSGLSIFSSLIALAGVYGTVQNCRHENKNSCLSSVPSGELSASLLSVMSVTGSSCMAFIMLR